MYDVIDDLREIGRPKAALALVPFLWHEDNDLASRTALNLATLLPKPEVENVLRDYPLTKEQRKADWFDWVWAPFNEYEPDGSSLPIITGRIGYLIDWYLPSIPFEMKEDDMLAYLYQMRIHQIEIPKTIPDIDLRIIIPIIINGQYRGNRLLFHNKKEEFIKLRNIFVDTPKPTLDDWKHIFVSPKVYLKIKSDILKWFIWVIFYFIFLELIEKVCCSNNLIEMLGTTFLCFLMFIKYLQIKRRLKNPLHGLLEPPKTNHTTAKKKQRRWDWFRK